MKLSSNRLRLIARNIKEARVNRNLTQEQVAEIAGISTVHYCQIELGNKSPSLETLINIAEALHVSIDSLVFGLTEETQYHDILRILKSCDAETVEKLKKVLYTVFDTFVLRDR